MFHPYYIFSFMGLAYYGRSLYKYIKYGRFERSSKRETLGNILMNVPSFKNDYNKQITEYYDGICDKNTNKWEEYGPLITKIPENGLSYEECDQIISKYTELTMKNIENKQFSGTIYPFNSHINTSWIEKDPSDGIYEQLQKLYAKIFVNANLWNSLHDGDFPATSVINYQLVAMVSDLFGGKTDQTMGIVTTGGTQSIMTAARSYCNYGILEKKLDPSDCVIIAPQTIHSSLMKAADAYKFKLILLPVDADGNVDIDLLENVVDYYGSKVVAIFCSYPSYPYGTRDKYWFFVDIAKKYRIGLHIDCCLGGFILNFEDEVPEFLNVDGVTSVSADTHKNGLAPKGSSVLMCNNMFGKNLMYYSIYTTIDWPGGLYGTPKDEGSQSCVESFCALITLLMLGKNTYKNFSSEIISACNHIVYCLRKYENIEILGGNPLNVVAFRFNDKYIKGSTYKLYDLLKEKGFILNCLLDDKIHLCVTPRFITGNNVDKFMEAFKECYEKVTQTQNQEIEGHARLYCSVDAMLVPKRNELSVMKYFENYFFGRLAAHDSIRYHFLSIINPFYNRKNDDNYYIEPKKSR